MLKQRCTGKLHAGKADYNPRIRYGRAVLPKAELPGDKEADSCALAKKESGGEAQYAF